MAPYGVNWNRTTVAKFETNQRASITVQELLALAHALRVPPVILISDPRRVSTFPINDVESVPALNALMWLIGREDIILEGETLKTSNYSDATQVIRSGWEFIEAVLDLTWQPVVSRGRDPDEVKRFEQVKVERDREALKRIRRAMFSLTDAGAALPAVPPFVLERANELDYQLPTDEAS